MFSFSCIGFHNVRDRDFSVFSKWWDVEVSDCDNEYFKYKSLFYPWLCWVCLQKTNLYIFIRDYFLVVFTVLNRRVSTVSYRHHHSSIGTQDVILISRFSFSFVMRTRQAIAKVWNALLTSVFPSAYNLYRTKTLYGACK